jgi:4-carboxymuconolactone decarboxylase
MSCEISLLRPSVRSTCAALVLGTLVSALPVSAQERMPPVPPEKYDEAQRKAAEEFQSARKAPVSGPFSIHTNPRIDDG